MSKLSDLPVAILLRVLQLSGAISITSAHLPSITWLAHAPSSAKSVSTGFLERVDKVRRETKSAAAFVMITLISAPSRTSRRTRIGILYAAMLPVIPISIFFPFTTVLKYVQKQKRSDWQIAYKKMR